MPPPFPHPNLKYHQKKTKCKEQENIECGKLSVHLYLHDNREQSLHCHTLLPTLKIRVNLLKKKSDPLHNECYNN